VGQADSQLIELSLVDSTKFRIMIDFGRNTDIDINNHTMDMCVITHSHSDHYSYSCDELNKFVCKTLIVSRTDIDCINQYQSQHNTNFIVASIGNIIYKDSNNEISIKSVKNSCSDPNDCSIGIYFNLNNQFKYFTAGDLKDAEESTLNLNKINVLKVSHHGSTTSSKPSYLSNIQPDVCIISSELIEDDCIPKFETVSNLLKYCNVFMTGDLKDSTCNDYNNLLDLDIHSNGNIKINYIKDNNYYYVKSNKINKKYYI
jgi:competence protein ComEC